MSEVSREQQIREMTKESEEKTSSEKFPLPEEYLASLEKVASPEHVEAYKKLLEIAEAIKQANGRGLLVGGSVRDTLFGKISKDFDLEVYGLPADKVEEIVSAQGKVSEVGKAFGILKVGLEGGLDIDVSLPRTDSKVSEGHKGFDVKTDPNMSVEEAARRRDFTMNSVAADPLTGEFYDYFGGVKDIKERRLRVTDEERFKDDPLRVLRGLQFIGRFGLSMDAESREIMKEMVPRLKELPKERIYEEWKKLLLKSDKPSLGLAAGMELGVYQELHPEFPPLVGLQQEPEWHPEGDVWVHTLMTVDAAAAITKRENSKPEEALPIMLAVLCHDLGKITTTSISEAGRIISHRHDKEGEEPTRKFLESLGTDNLTREKTVHLVVDHLTPAMLFVNGVEEEYKEQEYKETKEGETVLVGERKRVRKDNVSDGAIRRLAARLHPATIKEVATVCQADNYGRGPYPDSKQPDQLMLGPFDFPAKAWLLERARKLEVEMNKPANLVMGRDLIKLGYKPGIDFGEIIRTADDLRDEHDMTKDQVLELLKNLPDKDTQAAIKLLNTTLHK